MTIARSPDAAARSRQGPTAQGGPAAFLRSACALDLRSLALFRLLLGSILIADALCRVPDAPLTLTPDGMLPPDLVRPFVGHPWSWSIGLWCDATWWGYGLLVAEGLCGLLLAAGLGLPLTTTAAWVVVVSLVRRTAPVTNAGDVFLATLLFWGQFLPLKPQPRSPQGSRSIGGIAAFALMLQVAAVYLSAGMAKCNGVWWSGEAVGYALSVHDHGTPLGNLIAEWRWGGRLLTWATLVVELLGPPLLLLPHLRLPLVGTFVLFQMAIAVTMNVCLFPWVGIAAWAALLPGSFWDQIGVTATGTTSCGPAGDGLDRPRRILCGGAILVAVIAFSHANGPWRLQRMPAGLRHAVQLTFLEQDWRVFGDIRPQRQWVYGRAELANGEIVDLLRQGRPLETVLPSDGFNGLGDQRRQKLFWELPKPDHRVFAAAIATALARQWNSNQPPERHVISLEIHGARMITAPEPGAIQDVLMATWPLRSPTGQGNLERFLRDSAPFPDDADRGLPLPGEEGR
jgi:Vitamin K-dependent gamma-carboxylase